LTELDAAAMGEVTGDEEVTGASSDSSGGSDSNVGIIAGNAAILPHLLHDDVVKFCCS
jgi:hypothetical protein